MFTKIKLNLETSFILASCQGNISHFNYLNLMLAVKLIIATKIRVYIYINICVCVCVCVILHTYNEKHKLLFGCD